MRRHGSVRQGTRLTRHANASTEQGLGIDTDPRTGGQGVPQSYGQLNCVSGPLTSVGVQ